MAGFIIHGNRSADSCLPLLVHWSVLSSLPLILGMHPKIIYSLPHQLCKEEEQLNSTGFEARDKKPIYFTDLAL